MRTLHDILPRLSSFGDTPAIVSFTDAGTDVLTYGELAGRVSRLAGGLLAAGLRRGEPVAILAPNSAEWIIAGLAVMASGATLVPLDVRLPSQTLAHEVTDSSCARVFATRDTLAKLREAMPESWSCEAYLLDSAEDRGAERGWHSLLVEEPADLPALSPDETAVLFYTSGTTGRPKGVPLSHDNLLTNLAGLRGQDLARPGVRALLPLPLHHVYPFMIGMLVPLDGGATVVLPAGITGPQIVRALKEGRVTTLIGVPGLYEALVAAIRRRIAARGPLVARVVGRLLDLSIWVRRRLNWRAGRILLRPLHQAIGPELRIVSSGGAALDETLAWTLEGLGWQVLTGYGLTETAPIVTFTGLGRGRIGTAGQPLGRVEVRLSPVPDMPGGEIQVRGPNVFSGYRNRPEATERAFTPDGWFRTRDLGVMDSEGYLRILARADEMIVLPDGKNVHPEEVEQVYLKSPYLREAAVLKRRDVLSALLVPDITEIRQAGEGDISDTVRAELKRLSQGLPGYQRVSSYRITYDALPRTSLGKLKRHLLPGLFETAEEPASEARARPDLSETDRDLLSSTVAQGVLSSLGRLAPDRAVGLDDDLQVDLGIDSLAWVSLTLELEQAHGIHIDEAVIARLTTVRSLIEAVLQVEERAFERTGQGPIPETQLRWLEPTGRIAHFAGVILLLLNGLIVRALFGLRVEGRERLPGAGPLVLAPNHASFLDVFVLAAALPRRLVVRAYWAGTVIFLFNSRPRRLFSRLAHVFPVDPARSPISSFLMGAEALKRGHVLVWFPEGARSPDGRLQPFMPGIGRLIQQPDWQVVPVHIKGSFEAWPRDQRLPRLRRITVGFGELLGRADLLAKGVGGSDEARIADGLRRSLSALMAEDRSRRALHD